MRKGLFKVGLTFLSHAAIASTCLPVLPRLATNLLGYSCRDLGLMMYAVIYDGTCNLCVTLVRLLEQLDQGQQFQYVPMQQTATLQEWQISPQDCEQGMILLDQTTPTQRWQGSDAAEEIGRLLPLGNFFVQAYRSLPGAKAGGDGFYAFIRDHRYALFGGREGIYESAYPACEDDQCAQF